MAQKSTNACVRLLTGARPSGLVVRLLNLKPPGDRPTTCACNGSHHKTTCAVARFDKRMTEIGQLMRAVPPGHELVNLNGFAPRVGATVFLDGVTVTGIAR